MSFRLVYADNDFSVELPLEPHIEDRVIALLSRSPEQRGSDRATVEFMQGLAAMLTDMLDGAPLPPTDKQIFYAVQIARTLAIQLPADVLQLRSAMRVFLEENAPAYRRKKALERGDVGPYPR